jgi:hypothetical protein
VVNPERRCRGVARVLVDNVEVPGGAIPIVADAGVRHVHVVLGGPGREQEVN